MAQSQKYEGTWDEVNAQLAAHAEELRNHPWLRLVIEPADIQAQDHSLAMTPRARRGSMKDMIIAVAEDFDATPEGFEEYMP